MSEFSIIRNTLRFEGRFTQIPNDWIRDDRLGFRAKGVLVYLMSHQSGWKTSLAHLSALGLDGKDAIRSAVKELEDAGYLIRRRLRNNGQLAGAEWELQDPFETPMSENPTQGNQTLGNSRLENPTVKNTNIKNTKDLEQQDISNALFEKFWAVYPRRTNKGGAKTAFLKAVDVKVSFYDLMQAVERYASDPNLPEPQFIPHAATWLNQERWADGALPERKGARSVSANARDILNSVIAFERKMEGGQKEIGH